MRALVILLVVAAVSASAFLVRAMARVAPVTAPAKPAVTPMILADNRPEVWQVEQTPEFDSYSNGLRIENRYLISTRPRSYRVFRVDRPEEAAGPPRAAPAGIVFHTTESQQAPFEARQNRVLKQVGESILDYVRRHRAYNFLIDRFGRVYRVVRESDAAEHAGYSVWADQQSLYVNLNDTFLGVSFETRTLPGQENAAVTPGQIRAAAMLTEMLRSRYAIAAENCVTHAQVSVNPRNMRIGWHTDWASSFPFDRLGLPDNYAQRLPALAVFGFEYDDTFARLAGPKLLAAAELSEERLRDAAARAGVSVESYRAGLQRLYRDRIGGGHSSSAPVEGDE